MNKRLRYTNNPEIYGNEDYILTCSFSETLGKFLCEFNGLFFSYKTFGGMANKRNRLIEKYNLKPYIQLT